MNSGDDGRYYFQAGAILVPGAQLLSQIQKDILTVSLGFWRMTDKLGMPMEDIHITGSVPQCEFYHTCFRTLTQTADHQVREKLQYSMSRFFSKLSVEKPVVRNNYFFQVVRPTDDPARVTSIDPDELAWSDTTNGDEDHFVHHSTGTAAPTEHQDKTNEAEERETAGAKEEISLRKQKQSLGTDTVDRIRLRTERQSLRRLPRSGAIVFTIRSESTRPDPMLPVLLRDYQHIFLILLIWPENLVFRDVWQAQSGAGRKMYNCQSFPKGTYFIALLTAAFSK